MARKPRKISEVGIYHVIMRGNNRETLFYDDKDRLLFIQKLNKYIAELKIELYSYCLMGNHVHLLIGNANQEMPLLIKKLACSYVYYFNHKYDRVGHLFQGRYKSEPVETVSYFKTVYRYILQNPEKAGICSFLKYKWSSVHIVSSEDRYKKSILSVMFDSQKELTDFLISDNDDKCMEYFTQPISDDDIKGKFVCSLFKIKTPLELQMCSPPELKSRLSYLKKFGMSVSQISRLTGISKQLIRNA